MLTPPSSISPKRQRNELLQNSLCAVIVSAGRERHPAVLADVAPVVVALRRAAALDTRAGEGDLQMLRAEGRHAAVRLEGGVLPIFDHVRDRGGRPGRRSHELDIAAPAVPDLRVDAQDGPQRREPALPSAISGCTARRGSL